MNELNKTPKEIVKELDQYIVGQQANDQTDNK